MNNEDTRLINEEPINTTSSTNTFNSSEASSNVKKNSNGKTIGAAVGGFAAGAAVGGATGVMASNTNGDVKIEDNTTANQEENKIPEPDQVLLANNEGIRFAHIDADNFADAFTQAREQVGPGGAFEYNGKIYATYYANEWEGMTNEEKSDFQARVNDVAPAHTADGAASTHVAEHHETPNTHHETTVEPQELVVEEVGNNVELVAEEPVNGEVRVLGVEAVQNEDGSIMNVALLENSGDQALMVDVDNDGMIEVFVHDDNYDGQIQENEFHDISDAGIHMTDIMEVQSAQDGDFLPTSDDGMPDYINDADSIMEV